MTPYLSKVEERSEKEHKDLIQTANIDFVCNFVDKHWIILSFFNQFCQER